jgi:hypothetical protein
MPFRIRTRLSLLVCFALLAATGCGEEEDVSPNFEDRIPLGLELKAADRVVDWKDTTTLSGALTQGKENLAGETVVLEADSYPFNGSYAEIESVETEADGSFKFEAAPDANTAYRVAAGDLSEATSREVRVYVNPLTELATEPSGNGTRFITVFRHPAERSIQGSTVFNYSATVADAAATGKLRFIKADRVEQERQGLSSASITLPFAAADVEYRACYSYTPDSGMGVPSSRCSQSRIAAG